jgi:hypothetical protein
MRRFVAMKKLLVVLAVLSMAAAAWAAPAERYLHVRVDDASSGQKVRVNIPLSLAAQVIPAIDNGHLRGGKVEVGHFEANGVNVKQILDALKTAPDGEFVTVQQPGENVRVAKKNGVLIVHVTDTKHERQNVDVTVPWAVAEALASTTDQNQLNVEAAIQALEKAGNMTLVTVTGDRQNVRIWIDSNSTSPE